ncbi:hypothetical protein LXL04_023511 [Taraxacum kok-saghyz]
MFLYNTYLKGFVKNNLKKRKKQSCAYAKKKLHIQKLKKKSFFRKNILRPGLLISKPFHTDHPYHFTRIAHCTPHHSCPKPRSSPQPRSSPFPLHACTLPSIPFQMARNVIDFLCTLAQPRNLIDFPLYIYPFEDYYGWIFFKLAKRSYQLPKQKHKNGSLLAGTLLAVSPVSHVMAPMGAAQSAAKELLDTILDAIVRIFDNYAVVGELLESKSSQHAAMNTPKSMVATISGIPDSEASKDTRGYTIGFSMFVLQSECQQLICEILRATPEAASADAAVQTARLANKAPSKDKGQETHIIIILIFFLICLFNYSFFSDLDFLDQHMLSDFGPGVEVFNCTICGDIIGWPYNILQNPFSGIDELIYSREPPPPPQFPISIIPLFISNNRLRDPPKTDFFKNFYICAAFFSLFWEFVFVIGLVFERYLSSRSRFSKNLTWGTHAMRRRHFYSTNGFVSEKTQTNPGPKPELQAGRI